MKVYANRYYKSDKKGYQFLYEEDLFSDMQLCNNIENKLKEILGNRLIEGWIGSVVKDKKGFLYYFFGHNKYFAQESGNGRSSNYFSFICCSFEAIRQGINPKSLMEIIAQFEDKEFVSKDYNILDEDRSLDNRLPEVLAEAMALYIVNDTVKLIAESTEKDCSHMIELIWKKSLFSEKVPDILYLDHTEDVDDIPAWIFKVCYGRTLDLDYKKMNLRVEKQYLYEASRALYKERNNVYFTRKQRDAFRGRLGDKNKTLELELLLWFYALEQEKSYSQALPTREQKEALLAQIQ